MNVLSLGASFGALVWIFQDGHLSGFLGFTSTGFVDATQPILVLAIVFGLSMDYEVFLLSRIREQYDLTGDNTAAVATGLQRTGGIITSAALLLLVVIGAFSLSGITFIKMIGVAMLIAIVVDATIVRVLLVPATMRLLGRANWWAPGPLRRFYARYGIRESDGEPRRPGRELAEADPGLTDARRPGALSVPKARRERSDGRGGLPRGHRGRGTPCRRRSTGWVSSVSRGRGASRMRRGGSWDGGMSLPQPTQYRPRCSTALQCAHDDDMVPPRTGASPGWVWRGPWQVGTTEPASSRRVGRAVTRPSHWPGASPAAGRGSATCPLTSFARAVVERRTTRPGRSRGTPACGPTAAATRARRCC